MRLGFTKNTIKKIRLVLVGVLAVASLVNVAFAQTIGTDQPTATDTTVPKQTLQTQQDSFNQFVVQSGNFAIDLSAAITAPLIALSSWLLSPDWTYGDIFGMRGLIYKVWILASNLVYIIFAIILLIIAFANIFGKNSGHFAVKTALPKLVIGILIVPFSWFFVSATLSLANILTASAIALPFGMLNTGGSDPAWFTARSIPTSIIFDAS